MEPVLVTFDIFVLPHFHVFLLLDRNTYLIMNAGMLICSPLVLIYSVTVSTICLLEYIAQVILIRSKF